MNAAPILQNPIQSDHPEDLLLEAEKYKASNPIYRAALDWLELGVATIPVIRYPRKKEEEKKACFPWKHLQPGGRLPTLAELKGWFDRISYPNIGLILGWGGLTVLDLDALTYLGPILDLCPKLLETFTVQTARGFHYYFWIDEMPRSFKISDLGLEVRSFHQYVLGVGSRHPSGIYYQAVNSLPILSVGRLTDIIPEELLIPVVVHNQAVSNATSGLAPAKQDNTSERFNRLELWEKVGNPEVEKELTREFIHQVNREVEIARICDAEGFSYSHGSSDFYKLNCPWGENHKNGDANPSAYIHKTKNFFGCGGNNCVRKPLDPVAFYARLKNYSTMWEAARDLAFRFSVAQDFIQRWGVA